MDDRGPRAIFEAYRRPYPQRHRIPFRQLGGVSMGRTFTQRPTRCSGNLYGVPITVGVFASSLIFGSHTPFGEL